MTRNLRPRYRNLTQLALVCLLAPLPVLAESAAFDPIFTDHAVLQRGEKVHVWGTSGSDTALTVSLSGRMFPATVTPDGRWEAWLDPLTPGTGLSLSLISADGAVRAQVTDIAVGDVFLCSGQSNMEFQVKYATNAGNEISNSANPNIRFQTLDRAYATSPRASIGASSGWKVAAPDTTGEASAVCYYMSKSLQQSEQVPVGFIHTSWGGTTIQTWMSAESLRRLGTYDIGLEALRVYDTDPEAARTYWLQQTVSNWQRTEPDGTAHAAWIKPAFDDSGWDEITPAGVWESAGIPALAAFDGIVWYRNTVTLTADQARNARSISLGAVDDSELTWINGVLVGGTEGWNTPRDYALPRGLLKAGKNTIVVRAVDNGGGGGLSAQPEARVLTMADGTTQQLPDVWKYRIAGPLNPGTALPGTPWLPTSGLGMLYNAMLAPVSPYTLKAVAWYQGEANANEAGEYARLLPAMMADWRQSFNSPDLPFLIVQLTAYGPVATRPGTSSWAELRESQRLSVEADPHAALAVTVDFGDRSDIHPTQKTVVGQRLARAARAVVYGEKISPSGPVPVVVTRSGEDLVVRFRDVGAGLAVYSHAQAIGFEACESPTVCRYVLAEISGTDTVVLKGANTSDVALVRYAWADSPVVNLYSSEDLPAVPFQMAVAAAHP